MEKATHPEGYALALPTLDSDTPLYHYPIMLLAFALPSAIKKYRDRGFPDEEIKELLSALKGSICSVDSKTGKPSISGYHWLRHYTSAVIYNAGLFGVTPRIIDAPVMLLKNKYGEYKIIMTDGRFHSSGKILGSAGYTDEEGSFDAEFSEDDEYYNAHEVINSRVSKSITRISKREWQTVAKKGDWIVGLHIPKGADLSEEKMTEGFRSAMLKTTKRYPDLSPKAVHCSTWLLDPYLAEILGPGSKITGFINRFIKYPIKSGGKELFGFAFPSNYDSYEALPENSSLQRKLKALYINGGYIHAHSGFIPESDTWNE